MCNNIIFLCLQINGQDVSQASHEHVVSIIQQSGNLVAMTVITLQSPPFGMPAESNTPLPYRQCATLPRKLASKKGKIYLYYYSNHVFFIHQTGQQWHFFLHNMLY